MVEIKDRDTILFDLDGTIIKPEDSILNSLKYAFEKCHVELPDKKVLLQFIGPPLADSFQQFAGFTAEEAAQGIQYYREYYAQQGIFENQLHEGIPDLLKSLKSAGKTVIMATSKPEQFAKQIAAHLGIAEHFDLIAGASMDGTRSQKADIIAYALASNQISPENAVMVGDREYDANGARANQLPCIGVLYGYGSREELESAGATAIVPTVEALKNLLLKEGQNGKN